MRGKEKGCTFCCKHAAIAALVGQSVHTSASNADSLPGACEMRAARCCSRVREKRAQHGAEAPKWDMFCCEDGLPLCWQVLTTHSDDDVRRYRGNTGSRLKYTAEEGPLMRGSWSSCALGTVVLFLNLPLTRSGCRLQRATAAPVRGQSL